MIQTPKSTAAYQASLLAALQATGITQLSPGGKARAFMDTIGDQMAGLEARSYAAMAQTLLPYATGNNLDFLGQILSLPRLQAQDVDASALDKNFQFYVARGNFGSINNGSDIVVPAGTRVFTASDFGPVVVLSSQVTLPARNTSQPFSVQSLQSGAAGNTPAGVFTRTNFNNYADARYGSLLVTNSAGLIGGRDAESDDDYRYRLNLYLQSRRGAAEADLRLGVLKIPGIQDCVFAKQAGSYTCYVYGVSPSLPASLLAMVQGVIDDLTAFPLSGTAVTPDLLGISLSTTLVFKTTASSSDQQNAIAAATSAAQSYINNRGTTDPFVLNALADVIQSADSNILDIGQPNQPLNEVFLWRSRDDGSRYSRFLVADYVPQLGERLVVETSLTNPITLSIAGF